MSEGRSEEMSEERREGRSKKGVMEGVRRRFVAKVRTCICLGTRVQVPSSCGRSSHLHKNLGEHTSIQILLLLL